jgi:hypothetical protein
VNAPLRCGAPLSLRNVHNVLLDVWRRFIASIDRSMRCTCSTDTDRQRNRRRGIPCALGHCILTHGCRHNVAAVERKLVVVAALNTHAPVAVVVVDRRIQQHLVDNVSVAWNTSGVDSERVGNSGQNAIHHMLVGEARRVVESGRHSRVAVVLIVQHHLQAKCGRVRAGAMHADASHQHNEWQNGKAHGHVNGARLANEMKTNALQQILQVREEHVASHSLVVLLSVLAGCCAAPPAATDRSTCRSRSSQYKGPWVTSHSNMPCRAVCLLMCYCCNPIQPIRWVPCRLVPIMMALVKFEWLRLEFDRLALVRLELVRLALVRLALVRLALVNSALVRLALVRFAPIKELRDRVLRERSTPDRSIPDRLTCCMLGGSRHCCRLHCDMLHPVMSCCVRSTPDRSTPDRLTCFMLGGSRHCCRLHCDMLHPVMSCCDRSTPDRSAPDRLTCFMLGGSRHCCRLHCDMLHPVMSCCDRSTPDRSTPDRLTRCMLRGS